MSEENREKLLELYRALNDHDVETAMEHISPEIDWPDLENGTRIHGRAAFRAYWENCWKSADPRIEPLRIEAGAGTATVRVDQLIQSLDGRITGKSQAEHVFTFDGPFIARMTVIPISSDEDDEDEDDED